MKKVCPICESSNILIENYYHSCQKCHHNFLFNISKSKFMVNDSLALSDFNKFSFLNAYKSIILFIAEFGNKKISLLDIGSGSGKFLFSNKKRYSSVSGVELSPLPYLFSKYTLNLNVSKNIIYIPSGITFATAWHSFEHIQIEKLNVLLRLLCKKMKPKAKIIISVPNSKSFQYFIFKNKWAYFDIVNHVNQFSPDSLRILLAKYNFQQKFIYPSGPYNFFGYIQSLLNFIIKDHNYLYLATKRKALDRNFCYDTVILIFLIPILIISFILTLVDFFVPNKQGVLTICFQKSI